MIGSKPKRNFVPGTRRKSSMISASHRKRDSREALLRWLRDWSSGGRISHSGTVDCRFLVLDCMPFLDFESKVGSRNRRKYWLVIFFGFSVAGAQRDLIIRTHLISRTWC